MTIVYILTNEIMPEVIKIGITKNLEERIKSLDNTSTPLPFECYYAVETNNAKEVEKLLHETFEDKRIRKNREFFRCPPEQAKSALLIVEKLGGTDVTPAKYIVENKEDIKALKILIQEDLDVTNLMVQTVSCLFRLANFHFPGQLSDLQRCNHSFAIFPMH